MRAYLIWNITYDGNCNEMVSVQSSHLISFFSSYFSLLKFVAFFLPSLFLFQKHCTRIFSSCCTDSILFDRILMPIERIANYSLISKLNHILIWSFNDHHEYLMWMTTLYRSNQMENLRNSSIGITWIIKH